MSFNDRLSALGLSLPSLPVSAAHYVPARQHGNLVFASGQTPTVADALTLTGKLARRSGWSRARRRLGCVC